MEVANSPEGGQTTPRNAMMNPAKNLVKKAKKDPQSVYQSALSAESQGRPEEALALIQALVEVLPKETSLRVKQGSLLIGLGKFQQARAVFLDLTRREPLNPAHFSNLGICLSNRTAFSEAGSALERALTLKPDHVFAWNNLAGARRDSGHIQDSQVPYRRALQLDPSYTTAAWGLAIVSLMLGDYESGLALYEAGFSCGERVVRFSSQPRWDGKVPLRHKRLWIGAEQGYGDAIQMARYLLLPEFDGSEIIFEVPSPLIPLLKGLKEGMTLISKGSDPGPHDFFSPIMSLPHLLGTRLQTIPVPAPLKVDPDYERKWATHLGKNEKRRVGLAWSGNRGHKNDKNRSMPLETLLPLLELDAEFHVIQKDIREGDLAVLQKHPEIRVHTDALSDFADTAALLAAMDSLVSVDTSMVHLAGSLGKTCHVLLPFVPDYRWLLDRKDSPWYPSLRLHRQEKLGDWSTPLAQVLAALR